VRGTGPRVALASLSLIALLACAGATSVEVRDLDGRAVRPLAPGPERAVVLLFTATDCPISNRYAPAVGRLAATYGPRGARFYLVYADPEARPEAVRRHVEAFGYAFSALLDRKHALVRLVGATVTPEAAVFAREGREVHLAYRGRIDDWYEDFGRSRAAPTTHELKDALDAVLAGREPAVPRTTAIGCFIPGAS
jgi:thiol-disulfide isomerase/thioredoxin